MQTARNFRKERRYLILFLFSFLLGCTGSSTTDGRPNRGGLLTSGEEAARERGGTAGDWSKGSGQPGSGTTPSPQQNRSQ
jgi:hypothetical protein